MLYVCRDLLSETATPAEREYVLDFHARIGRLHRPNKPVLVLLDRNAYCLTMLDWNQCPAVERVPGKASGVWLFKRTRVPVKVLFEHRRWRHCRRLLAMVSGRYTRAGTRGS